MDMQAIGSTLDWKTTAIRLVVCEQWRHLERGEEQLPLPPSLLSGYDTFVECTFVECTKTLVEWNIGRTEHWSNGTFV